MSENFNPHQLAAMSHEKGGQVNYSDPSNTLLQTCDFKTALSACGCGRGGQE